MSDALGAGRGAGTRLAGFEVIAEDDPGRDPPTVVRLKPGGAAHGFVAADALFQQRAGIR